MASVANPPLLRLVARGDREIVMTREFDAPRQLVFDAWTKPELVERWFGRLEGWTTKAEVD
ncbi:MAG: ATPase, partial [Chloroflexi bacterium]